MSHRCVSLCFFLRLLCSQRQFTVSRSFSKHVAQTVRALPLSLSVHETQLLPIPFLVLSHLKSNVWNGLLVTAGVRCLVHGSSACSPLSIHPQIRSEAATEGNEAASALWLLLTS